MILLGSDGIFDKLDNENIYRVVWEETRAFTESLPANI